MNNNKKSKIYIKKSILNKRKPKDGISETKISTTNYVQKQLTHIMRNNNNQHLRNKEDTTQE